MSRGFSIDCPLTRLSRDFHQFGLLDTAPPPWMTAQIDQHAAAVRTSIQRDGVRLSRRSLAHYVRGFLDGTLERGWASDDTEYDWETLRLMAVCWLAKEQGFVR